jgi:hypothetical protein
VRRAASGASQANVRYPTLQIESVQLDRGSCAELAIGMGKKQQICLLCGELMPLALPLGGKGQRTFRCLDFDSLDPLKSGAQGGFSGELRPT